MIMSVFRKPSFAPRVVVDLAHVSVENRDSDRPMVARCVCAGAYSHSQCPVHATKIGSHAFVSFEPALTPYLLHVFPVSAPLLSPRLRAIVISHNNRP
jgi:hypothetical protein